MKFFVALVLSSACVIAATTHVSDGSRDDVAAKIASASDGDTITLPEGTFGWSTGVSFSKHLIIQGAGSGKVMGVAYESETWGTGSKTWTVQEDQGITVGMILRAVQTNTDATTYYMQGEVTGVAGDQVTINVTTNTGYPPGSWNSGLGGGGGTSVIWTFYTPPLTVIENAGPEGGAMFSITESTAGSSSISGIFFDGRGPNQCRAINLYPATGGNAVLIHDNFFHETTYSLSIYIESMKGIIYRCYFFNALTLVGAYAHGAIQNKPENAFAVSTWATASTMGTSDSTGLNNFYIEDCTFHAYLNVTDFDGATRAVYRYNLNDHSGLGSHGRDTGPIGNRHWEIYQNRFRYYNAGDNSLPVNQFILMRGGTGVIYDNYVDNNVSGYWGDKSEVVLGIFAIAESTALAWSRQTWTVSSIGTGNPSTVTVTSTIDVTDNIGQGIFDGMEVAITGSNSTPSINGVHTVTRINSTSFSIPVNVTGAGTAGTVNPIHYPAPRQVGFGYVTGTGVDGYNQSTEEKAGSGTGPIYVGDSEPVYIWGNAGYGVSSISLNDGDDGAPVKDDINYYLISGRDYYLNDGAKPGYTAYTYPHPLRGESAGTTTITGTLTVTGTIILE